MTGETLDTGAFKSGDSKSSFLHRPHDNQRLAQLKSTGSPSYSFLKEHNGRGNRSYPGVLLASALFFAAPLCMIPLERSAKAVELRNCTMDMSESCLDRMIYMANTDPANHYDIYLGTGQIDLRNGLRAVETPNWLRIIGVSAGTTEIHRHCDTPRDRATGECTTVGEFPVFQVNEKAVLVLSGVSVTGGQSGTGGGILNQGSLLVYDSTISQNHGHFAGGGIYQGGPGNPWLYLQDSTVNDNSVHFIGGGGIFIDSGTTQITHSTIHSNWTVPSSRGGTAIGGGIANGQIIYETDMNGSRVIGPDGEPVEKERTGGVLSIVNSTIIGNIDHSPQKLGAAGGITRIGGEVWLKNVTITDNEVKSPPNAYAYGNGIFGLGGFYFANTIIARNDLAPECGGLVFTLGGNLVGTSYGCHIEATAWDDSWPPPAKDRIGNPSACDHNPDVNCLDQKYLNPLFEVGSDLRPLLKDNGGTSCTVALQQGSMAINNAWTGKPGQHPFACDAYDQRWIQRDSATTGANCDIGAFEFKSGKITPSGLGCSRQAH